jgi:hypothetical protein
MSFVGTRRALLRGQKVVTGAVTGYTFRSQQTVTDGGFGNNDLSVDLGPASAGRLVVVAFGVPSNAASTLGVTCNSVTLTKDADQNLTQYRSAIFSGVVPTGSGVQTIHTTNSSVYLAHFYTIWTLTGLASTLVKHTGGWDGGLGSTGTINVSAGDFLFVQTVSNTGGTPDYSGSTQVAAATRSQANVYVSFSADWTITASNAAFTVQENAPAATTVMATYR